MKCTNCGADLVQGAKFCSECGKPVDSNSHFDENSTKTQNFEEKRDLGQEKLEEVKKEIEKDQTKIEDNIDQTMGVFKEKVIEESEEVKSSVEKEIGEFKESTKEQSQKAKEEFQDLLGKAGVTEEEINFNSNSEEITSVELKPSVFIKLISIFSACVLVTFSIVYLIDLVSLIFKVIGGIF